MPAAGNDSEMQLHGGNEVVENVKVAVRCRPLNSQEGQQQQNNPLHQNPSAVEVAIVDIDASQRSVLVANPNARSANEPSKCYAFDEVFGPCVGQLDVYERTARPIVENVLRGFNGTIFAYGQTGTGKTYTMSGDADQNMPGIIQYSFAHIFDHIARSGHEMKFLVRISYMEIYNEEVRDLLARNAQSPPQSLEIKERQDIGVYVKDLLNVTVSNADQCMRIMQFGNANRHTGRTAMNEQSSRSHAIFTITIERSESMDSKCQAEDDDQQQRQEILTQGKLSFVDLAGSERQSKTKAEGERLKEATKINLSLSTLGNVISALAEHGAYVPYRNSKLTRILSDSLGGNSKTCMIANIGPAAYNYEETISTLRYASRAKRIQNVARINQDPKDALLRRFQEEIELLKRQLEQNAAADHTLSDAENESSADEQPNGSGGIEMGRKKLGKPSQEDAAPELKSAIKLDERERRRLAEDLLRREEELKRNKREREKLAQKLQAIERQIIAGGENMLEKVEEQTQLLEESNKDLEQARKSEQALHERYRSQQAEQLDIEEKNATMQEQAQMLGKKLKKSWTQYMQAKGELQDQEMEHHRETEALLESIRQLERELLYATLLLEQSIPDEQQQYIERFVHWNEEIGDWQLKCIAYTGNNIRAENPQFHSAQYRPPIDPQLKPLFLSYADFVDPAHSNPIATTRSSSKKAKEAARIRQILD